MSRENTQKVEGEIEAVRMTAVCVAAAVAIAALAFLSNELFGAIDWFAVGLAAILATLVYGNRWILWKDMVGRWHVSVTRVILVIAVAAVIGFIGWVAWYLAGHTLTALVGLGLMLGLLFHGIEQFLTWWERIYAPNCAPHVPRMEP